MHIFWGIWGPFGGGVKDILWNVIIRPHIDALGDNKGRCLNRFLLHHGIGVLCIGQVVELNACYMLFEKFDLYLPSCMFIDSVAPAPANISPQFQALVAKLEAQDKHM